jgi:ribosomal protein S9
MGLKGMHRISIIAVLAVLSTQCHAQGGPNPGQCEQVRDAIAQYGLQAARKHAMANYGMSAADLRRVEQECGVGGRARRTKR